jgi:hypothetical protein
MFNTLEKTENKIIYDVPYYPQKEQNSCWYYALKMVIKSCNSELKFKTGWMDSREQACRNGRINDVQELYTGNNCKIIPGGLTGINLYKLYKLLDEYGPIIVASGHVLPIVGCDISTNKVIFHWTAPKTWEYHNNLKRPSSRFFTGAGGELKGDWFNSENSWFVEHLTGRKVNVPEYSRQEMLKALKRLNFENVENGLEQEYLNRLQNPQLIMQYMDVFTEEIIKKTAYMSLPIEEFYHKMKDISECYYFVPEGYEAKKNKSNLFREMEFDEVYLDDSKSLSNAINTQKQPVKKSLKEQTDEYWKQWEESRLSRMNKSSIKLSFYDSRIKSHNEKCC